MSAVIIVIFVFLAGILVGGLGMRYWANDKVDELARRLRHAEDALKGKA